MKATVTKGILIALIVFNFVLLLQNPMQSADFSVYYRAALLVRNGQLHHLYERSTQQAFPGFLGTYFYHPVFELPIFLPLAWFSFKTALILWTITSACVLGLACWILGKRFDLPVSPALLAFSLFPALIMFSIGQDSAWLLLLFVLAYRHWERNENALSGVLLACALIKFQYSLPLAAFLIFRRRSRSLIAGFLGTTFALLLCSWLAIGTSGFVKYWNILRNHDVQQQERMLNLRGLIGLFGEHPTVTVVMSFIAVAWLLSRTHISDRHYFGAAVTVSFLVSYHALNYDSVILLIPLFLVLSEGWWFAWIFWVEPLYLALARLGVLALFAIPIIALAARLTQPPNSGVLIAKKSAA